MIEESTILTKGYLFGLKEMIGKDFETKLIYKASRDGWDAADFHRCCDNNGPTISICKSESGTVFGGFTETLWASTNLYGADPKKTSFIYILNKNRIKMEKLPLTGKHNDKAVVHNNDNCCVFGYGYDIGIKSETDISSNLGWSYCYPFGADGVTYLVGTNKFKLINYEVHVLLGNIENFIIDFFNLSSTEFQATALTIALGGITSQIDKLSPDKAHEIVDKLATFLDNEDTEARKSILNGIIKLSKKII